MDNMEQSGFELDALSEYGLKLLDQDIQPMKKPPLCAALSRDFEGAHHNGLRGLPVSPYITYMIFCVSSCSSAL